MITERRTLDPFQVEAIEFMNKAGKAILGDPMGARKTATTIAWLRQFEGAGTAQQRPTRALIVVPNITIAAHWMDEFQEWAPEWNTELGIGTKAKRALAYDFIKHHGGAYITTYSSMVADAEQLGGKTFDTFICDEAHALKDRKSQRTKAAHKIGKTCDYRVLLTGTVIRNAAEELFSMLHMLYPKSFKYWTHFLNEFFITELTTFHGKLARPITVVHGLQPGADERLRFQLQNVLIERDLEYMFPGESWIEDPDHIHFNIELSPEERKAYKQMVKHHWVDFPMGVISATNRLAVATRLRVFASDWGVADALLPDGAKVKFASEYLNEKKQPFVVFTSYKATANRLAARLTRPVRVFHGDTSPQEKADAIKDFQAGEVDVLVGTFASLGEGVDGLQHRGQDVLLVDHDWVPGNNDQAIGRVRRSGQKGRVVVHHLWATGTIDRTVEAANRAKVSVIRLMKGNKLSDLLYGRAEIEVEDE